MTAFPSQAARTAVAAALAEDESSQDGTTAWSVPQGLAAVAEIRARQGGIAGGLPVVAEVFAQVDPEATVESLVPDSALTHSAPALDLTMLLTTDPVPCPR
jgi:nicotinate-nucleotide pyrophosphorylase (carboxylating)